MAAFMKPQYLEGKWFEVETSEGIFTLPSDLVGEPPLTGEAFQDYIDGEYVDHEIVEGVGARLSAPGYLDCTDWTVCKTLAEAKQHIEDTFDVNPETGDLLE